MKILFLIREDYLKKSGGDTFQALKTKEYLEKYEDVSIDISHTVDNIDLSKYEIIHIFNIQIVNFAYDLVKQCKKYSKKVFLSPIMWDMSDGMYASYYFKYFTNFNCFNKFKFVRKIFDFVMLKHKNKIKYILSQCDCILPNSTEEDNYLKRKYKVNYKSVIVPNCIDIKLKPIQRTVGYNDYVLEVGRIEPVKNQLGLLKSLMDYPNIPLIFIGKKNQNYQKYLSELEYLAKKRGNTYFIEHMPQEDLILYYKNAKVHALPSFRESPGLVTLEALFYKTNVVVSNEVFCPIGYYGFNNIASVCNPYNIDSIKEAVLEAYIRPKVNLEEKYFNFISYDNAAKITLEAYMNELSTYK